jgi:hypothetical protein
LGYVKNGNPWKLAILPRVSQRLKILNGGLMVTIHTTF